MNGEHAVENISISLAKAINKLIASVPVDTNYISDGYHTFGELYQFRMVLTALLFNEWNKEGITVYKTTKDSEGKDQGNWFIVVAELPTGQISFHYPHFEGWELFKVPVKEKVEKYDGHTSIDVLSRLEFYLHERD